MASGIWSSSQPSAKWVGWSESLSELVAARLTHIVSGSPGMPGTGELTGTAASERMKAWDRRPGLAKNGLTGNNKLHLHSASLAETYFEN